MTVQTLDQQRARDAWEKSGAGVGKFGKEYVNLSKSLPALVMNTGLMQVMAFLHQKGEPGVHVQIARRLAGVAAQSLPTHPRASSHSWRRC